jgi:hypothetical protein
MVAGSSEAEKPFRLLLRGPARFELPPTPTPRIQAVFHEGPARRRQAILPPGPGADPRELARTGDPPAQGRGDGSPLTSASSALRSPAGWVHEVHLRYRREGDKDFASLPLARDGSGAWTATVPGEWTESDKPYHARVLPDDQPAPTASPSSDLAGRGRPA